MGKSKDLATGAAYQDQTESDTRYVNASGDTVTGALTVDTSTTTNLTVDSGNYGGIQFKAAGTDTGYITSYTNGSGAEAMYIGGADTVNLHTGTNHGLTNGTTRLGIDSSGHVTMPYQPAFRAWLQTEWTTTGAYVSSGWNETYDRNNDFNQGTFTAPVTGVYHFTVNWDSNASQSQLHLYHNGNYTYRREPTGRTDDNWESYGYSVDVKMAANDYVKLYLQTGSGNNPIHMGGGYWGNFQGHLIG